MFVDSPLEEAGFEPSVPRDTPKFSTPAHVTCFTSCTRKSRREREPILRGCWPPPAEPMVRIRLPPAASPSLQCTARPPAKSPALSRDSTKGNGEREPVLQRAIVGRGWIDKNVAFHRPPGRLHALGAGPRQRIGL